VAEAAATKRGSLLRSYVAYGLGIQSYLALPELVPAHCDPDVRITRGRLDPLPADCATPVPGERLCSTASEVQFSYADVGGFLVRGGNEIIIDPFAGLDESVLRLFLLGPALGVLLHQRGHLVLHASAVASDGDAVAFLGGSGWGKSTTAAALQARGYALVADDVTPVQFVDEGVIVHPGFPRLKLWPDSVVALGEEPERLPRLRPEIDKRDRPTEPVQAVALPLRRIYVLADGEAEVVERLSPRDGLIELVRHSYAINLLQPTGTAAANFDHCARLVEIVAIHRLRRRRSFAALASLTALIEADLKDAPH